MTPSTDLLGLLRPVEVVLFGFVGPLCDVFAELPAPDIAAELIGLIEAHGQQLRERADDPHEVLRSAGVLGRDLLQKVEDTLSSREVEAVRLSKPNLAGVESLRACTASGRRAAIVSNNAAEAVLSFLDGHKLRDHVSSVVGRRYANPERMKPDPAPVKQALTELDVRPDRAVLVGDSQTDIDVCRVSGVPCMAYANKPGKRGRFREADVVIEDMADLATALRAPA